MFLLWTVYGDLQHIIHTEILCNFHSISSSILCRYNTHEEKHNELTTVGMKNSMEDLFFQYHVNAAFSGHVHAYERFLPMYKNKTTVNGTIYMTVGTGGQLYGEYPTVPAQFQLFIVLLIAYLLFCLFSSLSNHHTSNEDNPPSNPPSYPPLLSVPPSPPPSLPLCLHPFLPLCRITPNFTVPFPLDTSTRR